MEYLSKEQNLLYLYGDTNRENNIKKS